MARGWYQIIILRTHSSGGYGLPTFLYTSEPYSSTKYLLEQYTDQLAKFDRQGNSYFAVGPEFIHQSMNGDLHDTTIIAMGCNGASTSALADAFLGRGAIGFIGWDQLVTADRSDEATLHLLDVLVHGRTVNQAVSETMNIVGPDQTYNSILQSKLKDSDYAIQPDKLAAEPMTPATVTIIPPAGLLAAVAVVGVFLYRLISIFRLTPRNNKKDVGAIHL